MVVLSIYMLYTSLNLVFNGLVEIVLVGTLKFLSYNIHESRVSQQMDVHKADSSHWFYISSVSCLPLQTSPPLYTLTASTLFMELLIYSSTTHNTFAVVLTLIILKLQKYIWSSEVFKFPFLCKSTQILQNSHYLCFYNYFILYKLVIFI